AVNPTMSAKSTVTTRRSSPPACRDRPQAAQNRAPVGASLPHAGHTMGCSLRTSVQVTGARIVAVVALDPALLSADVAGFLAEYHLATLTTLRPDGSPHVVPVGFVYDVDDRVARIISFPASRKVRNLLDAPGSCAVVCQVDGG